MKAKEAEKNQNFLLTELSDGESLWQLWPLMFQIMRELAKAKILAQDEFSSMKFRSFFKRKGGDESEDDSIQLIESKKLLIEI